MAVADSLFRIVMEQCKHLKNLHKGQFYIDMSLQKGMLFNTVEVV